MWLLQNDEKGLIYRVTPGKQHVVTRKDGDLLLLGDQSISRKHAELFVDDENQNGGVILKDLGSKYGTFVHIGDEEQAQLSPNQQVTLRHGDSVKFGIQWNKWRAEYVQLLVATSTLTQEEKTQVKQMVGELGGQVVSEWQENCTHLTMNKLTVTVKVVCALASAKPIVTPLYWKRFTQALTSLEATRPDCKDFVPPLAEALLNPSEVSFTPNPNRCKLFNECTFVASTPKQLSRIRPMITAAGGKAVEFSAIRWSESNLLEDNKILLQHSANEKQGSQMSQIPDGYKVVARKLRTQGVRCVPESEIGLSVLYCSMVQYCNPRYNVQSLFGSRTAEATQHLTVICPNTEESVNNEQNSISSAQSSISALPNSKKRLLENGINEDVLHINKKIHCETESEDLFGSQNANNSKLTTKTCESSNNLKKITRSSATKEKVPLVPGSLHDIFASSGERSVSSNIHNQTEIRPSCEDMFGSVENKRPQNSKADDINEFSFPSNKKSKKTREKISDQSDGDLSFTSNIKSNKTHKGMLEDDCEFSFISNKKSSKQPEKVLDEDNEFKFTTNKRSSKRCREREADIFATGNGTSIAGPSKIQKTNERNEISIQEKDDIFTFPGNNKQKVNYNENLINSNISDAAVKIALFSKKEIPDPSNIQVERDVEEPPEAKGLITYSKHIPMLSEVKEEVVDKELDELAKELQNTTIVVVKPLVVAREKPTNVSSAVTGSKNFKKFHKVVGMNKRVVPHIIGGSDLVPHYNRECAAIMENLNGPSSHNNWNF